MFRTRTFQTWPFRTWTFHTRTFRTRTFRTWIFRIRTFRTRTFPTLTFRILTFRTRIRACGYFGSLGCENWENPAACFASGRFRRGRLGPGCFAHGHFGPGRFAPGRFVTERFASELFEPGRHNRTFWTRFGHMSKFSYEWFSHWWMFSPHSLEIVNCKLVWGSKLIIPHFHRPVISNTKANNILWSRSGLSSKETTDKWLAPVISNLNSVAYKKKKIILNLFFVENESVKQKKDYPLLYIFFYIKTY